MDAQQLMDVLPEYGATTEYDFLPGVTLKLRGIQSFAEYRAIAGRVEHVKQHGGRSVPVGEYTVTIDDETLWTIVMVQTAILDPQLTYSQVVNMAYRAGTAFAGLVAEVTRLSGATLETSVEAAAPADPFPDAGPERGDEDATPDERSDGLGAE